MTGAWFDPWFAVGLNPIDAVLVIPIVAAAVLGRSAR